MQFFDNDFYNNLMIITKLNQKTPKQKAILRTAGELARSQKVKLYVFKNNPVHLKATTCKIVTNNF